MFILILFENLNITLITVLDILVLFLKNVMF